MKNILIAFLLFSANFLQGQVAFEFIPEIHGRNVDGLISVRVTSSFPNKQLVKMLITVSDKKYGTIVQIKTNSFDIYPGANTSNNRLLSGSNIAFAGNELARIVKQTAVFPEGEYEYCYELLSGDDHSAAPITEQCFSYVVEPLTPLMLIEPFDRQPICDKRPLFTWQPLMPAIPGMMYQLLLTEIRDGQSATEAVHYNLPIVNQAAIAGNMLMFPPSARELVEKKRYAWQVTAYRSQMILSRSEIWEFVISCEDSAKPEIFDGYRNIEDLFKGNYYIASGELLFAMHNPYESRELKYSIISLSKPDQKISKLPSISLKRGDNNINISLVDNKSFVDGSSYILNIEMPDRSIQKLRFTYKNPQ